MDEKTQNKLEKDHKWIWIPLKQSRAQDRVKAKLDPKDQAHSPPLEVESVFRARKGPKKAAASPESSEPKASSEEEKPKRKTSYFSARAVSLFALATLATLVATEITYSFLKEEPSSVVHFGRETLIFLGFLKAPSAEWYEFWK